MALGLSGLNPNTNLPGLMAQRSLTQANRSQQSALEKLSSGLRINQARDNPAGLVISEHLRAQLGGLQQAMRNSQEAYNTLSIAEGGLQEASSSLLQMRQLAVHALNAGTTDSAQVSADQAELNGLVNTVANVAGTTRYAESDLLNGAQQIDFRASGDTAILDREGTRINLVSGSADVVQMRFAGGAGNQAERAYVESDAVAGGALAEETTLTVEGTAGSREFTFRAGTTVEEMVQTVNSAADQTGVEAFSFNSDTQLRLVSEDYGADAFVQVEQGEGGRVFTAADPNQTTVRDQGQNATVQVKGIEQQTDGLDLDVANSAFSGTFSFNAGDPARTTVAQAGYGEDTLTDAAEARDVRLGELRGGMQLQLGEGEGTQNRETVALNDMSPENLGRVTRDGETFTLADLRSGGAASLAEDPAAALAVIDQAITDVASERGRIGAYQSNTLQRNINSLGVAVENVTATESGIRDADMARQMTNFVRNQILQRSSIYSMQAANVNAHQVLGLLGEA
jgi:flagellin